jgi:hypothetical protein
MQAIRRAVLTFAGILAVFASSAVPASAQMASAPMSDQGPSLLWVWVWILVAGIAIFVGGTCFGVGSGKR